MVSKPAESAAVKAWHVSLLDSFRRISKNLTAGQGGENRRTEGGNMPIVRYRAPGVATIYSLLVSSFSVHSPASAGPRRLPRAPDVVEYKFKD